MSFAMVPVVPEAAVQDNGDGTVDITTPGFDVTALAATRETDGDGVDWICPQ